MARLARRTLLILLPSLIEGALLFTQSHNATTINSTISAKVEVIEAKDSISHSLANSTYGAHKGTVISHSLGNSTHNIQSILKDSTRTGSSKPDGYKEFWHRRRRRAKESDVHGIPQDGPQPKEKYYLEKGCKIVKEPRAGLKPDDDKPPYETKHHKHMTHDACYYYCQQFQVLFFAIRKGEDCMCFDRYEFLLTPDPGVSCDKKCPGDQDIICGGDEAYNVYVLESWVPELEKKDCKKPDPVPHIKEMCENGGEEHGLTCDVKCNQGYRVAQNSLMCDTAAGMWFGFVHCAPYLCLPPAPPIAFASKTCAGGAVEGVKHAQFGIDCPVSCLPGYDLKENTLKCSVPDNPEEPAGVLKGKALCEPRSCGPPKKVDHALFPLGEMNYPTRVLYTCQNGYTTTGALTGMTYSHVMCQDDGKFEDVKFQCLPLVCGHSPPIANAELTLDPPDIENGWAFPAAAVYKCKKGFSQDGTGTGERVVSVPCQATGAFPDPLPGCKPVKCGGPPGVAFSKLLESDAVKGIGVADVAIAPLGFEQTATITCKTGYSFKPEEDPNEANMKFMVECEDNGLFDNVQVCQPLNCGEPPRAKYTVRADVPIVFGTEVEYSCLDGYSLTGTTQGARSFKLDCLETRRFSALPKAGGCLPLECGRPANVEHGKLVRGTPGELVKFPSTLQYKCDEGFSTDRTKSSGAAVFSVGCESTGQFSDMWECLPIDDCVGHTCGPQGECADLHMDYKCVCDAGFEAVVNPLTNEKECGNINDCGPEACGQGRCEDLVQGYKCHCPTGFEVKTPDGSNETCARVECGDPPISQNGDRPDVKGSYEDIIAYTCKIGYTLNGKADGVNMFHSTCQASKQFTTVPDCKPVECGYAGERDHSTLDKTDKITYKQKIRYTCKEGYSTDGSLIEDAKSYGAECLETGAFTDLMDCVPIICGSPKGLAFSSVSATVLTFQQEATYQCLQGYSTDGSTAGPKKAFKAKCEADGSFKREAPGCEAIKCGGAPTIADAVTELVEGDVVFPSLLGYSCLEGFSLNGKVTGERTFTTKCEADGKFSGKRKCLPVSCGPPPEAPHTRILSNKEVGVFGNIFKFKCHDGYGLEPLPTDMELIQPGGEEDFAVTCQANGEYSALSTCKNIDDCVGHTCGPHGTCVDGIMEFTCNCEAGFEEVEQNGEPYCGNVDDCGNHKCGEHGTCVDLIEGYTCSCSTGYKPKEDGTDTVCKPNSCGDMPVIEHAEHDSSESELVYPMTVTYACAEGYSIDSTLTETAKTFQVTCDANGEKENIQTCLPVKCAPPGGILNLKSGPVLTELAKFTDKLHYECADGYTTTGEAAGKSKFDLECGSQGLFLPEVFPVCAPVKCGMPPEVGKANYPEGLMFFPARVPYACDAGYSMDGTKDEAKKGFSIKCQKDGTFEALPSLGTGNKCEKIKCGKFPDVANADYSKKDANGVFEDSDEYKCKSGHTIDGSPQGQTSWVVTCQANGEFSLGFECMPVLFQVLGKMKDATNNAPVPGGKATLTYVEGPGEIESAGNSIGEFNLQGVKQGKIKIKYTAPGYIDAEVKLNVQNNIQSGTAADVAMSPILPPDGWRAVLAWGSKPRDLDTHLRWSTNRGCKVAYYRRRMDCSDGIKATLDVDDVNGYGPETLTFKNVGHQYNSRLSADRAPILAYKIHNYSRRPTLDSLSDATVTLYHGDTVFKEYKIGRDGVVDGRWWYVFELNGYTEEVKTSTGPT